jgi:beta-galactosidase
LSTRDRPVLASLSKAPFGGDWNPEQWDAETVREDIRLFGEAGIDLVTVNVFGWTKDQPEESRYDFAWLDEIIHLAKAAGINVCLATGTAAHPAWMAKKYPDILRTDFSGRRRKWGDRHNACPSSPAYRKFAPALAAALAERYRDEKAVVLWHISNEYLGMCYCERCEAAFRLWLKKRYGSLDALNAAWNSRFWSQYIGDWDEIVAPNQLTVQWSDRSTANQPLVLDYSRFFTDAQIEVCALEADEIHRLIPGSVVTTNFMGTYRPYDYRRWAQTLDVVSWDSYPSPGEAPDRTAFAHATMRGLKNGQSFLLMEQTPSQTNWQPVNTLKRPGVMRLQSWQAIAHGSDSVLFFQMRRARGACEKFHGAVIDHHGRSDVRVFREVSALGAELSLAGDAFLGGRTNGPVAIWFDWESWWAVENSMGPNGSLSYYDVVQRHYAAFHRLGVPCEVVGPGSDLSGVKVLWAPLLYLMTEETSRAIESFVASGGLLLTGCMSGVAEPSDLVFRGGAPGPLKKILGLWVEETDTLPVGTMNRVIPAPGQDWLVDGTTCTMLYDVVRLDGADGAAGAEVLATYGNEFYAGTPVLTRHAYGSGEAWYFASLPDDIVLDALAIRHCALRGVTPLLPSVQDGIEVTRRMREGREFYFVLNHTDGPKRVELGSAHLTSILGAADASGSLELPAYGVYVGEKA